MQKKFDSLINSFIDHEIGITENFLSRGLVAGLKSNLEKLYQADQLHLAGTGNEAMVKRDNLYRSDVIHWLDREHNDPHENDFFDLMDEFILHLNRTCYTGINSYEFHYTLYETGSFYKKHVDQFRDNDSRQYSMISYLNDDWLANEGGELRIYQASGTQDISPESGKTVFFKSGELHHEVLVTKRPRMSITGWLKIN